VKDVSWAVFLLAPLLAGCGYAATCRNEILEMSACQITDRGMAGVSELRNLRKLNLPACDGISDAGLQHLGALSGLRVLELAACSGITDAGIDHLKTLKLLEVLDLARCGQVTDLGIERLQAALPGCKK